MSDSPGVNARLRRRFLQLSMYSVQSAESFNQVYWRDRVEVNDPREVC